MAFYARATAPLHTLLLPGKARDGWWTNADLAKQLGAVIPLIVQGHKDCELVFAFDNSMNHHAYAEDGLVVSRMNLHDGGKNVPVEKDILSQCSRRVSGAEHANSEW